MEGMTRYAAPGYGVDVQFTGGGISGRLYARVTVSDRAGHSVSHTVQGADWDDFGGSLAACIAAGVSTLEVSSELAGGEA